MNTNGFENARAVHVKGTPIRTGNNIYNVCMYLPFICYNELPGFYANIPFIFSNVIEWF